MHVHLTPALATTRSITRTVLLSALVSAAVTLQETPGLAKKVSRDDSESMIAHLLFEGYLQLDFACTAYATNTYLKLGSRASLLLQGVQLLLVDYAGLRLQPQFEKSTTIVDFMASVTVVSL